MPPTYQCEQCHETFEYEDGWSDADAQAEYDHRFGHLNLAPADTATVCDDCYKLLLATPQVAQ